MARTAGGEGVSITVITNNRLSDYGVLTIVGGPRDGRRADSLRRTELFQDLTRMGVSGIDPAMGKTDLLAAFHRQCQQVADESLQSTNTKIGRPPPPLSQIVARQAAALIARMPLDDTPEQPLAPARPIASTSVRS